MTALNYAFSNPGYFYNRVRDVFGYSQKENAQNSIQAQIDYNEYLKAGYQRQFDDWQKRHPGRSIRYPELSFPGNIYRTDTATARAGFDYANAESNYYGNLIYRTAGLYGVFGRLSRTL